MQLAARSVVGSLRLAAVVACAGSGAAGCVSYGAQQTAHVSVVANVTPATVNNGGPRLDQLPDVPSVPGARVTGATIRATLDLHGSWLEDETYGSVWVPSRQAVGPDFVPYGSNGQWVLTDAGWYWQSTLAWGWLTFHYGRWVLVREEWAWVPGAMFAPAWVDWRVGGGWVGWAPLPPNGAAFIAPYAFCRHELLGTSGFWSGSVYGPAAVSLYSSTSSLRGSYGIGGAVYAWGPTPAGPAVVGPPTRAVSITDVWRREVSPRAGVPVASAGGGGGGAPMAGASPRAGVPAGDSGGAPGGAMGRPSGGAGLSGVDVIAPVAPPASTPTRSSAVTSYDPARAPASSYVGSGGFGRYGADDAVVIRGSVPEASSPPRRTISLGTAESSVPSSIETAPSWSSAPIRGSAPVSAFDTRVYAPSPAAATAVPTATSVSPSAVPSAVPAVSSWTPPPTSAMPPAYGASVYNAGGYAPRAMAPASPFNPSGATTAPAYVPTAGGAFTPPSAAMAPPGVPFNAGGGFTGGYVAPPRASAYAPPPTAGYVPPSAAGGAYIPPPASSPAFAPAVAPVAPVVGPARPFAAPTFAPATIAPAAVAPGAMYR